MNINDIIKAVKAQKENGTVKTMHNQTELMNRVAGNLEKHVMSALKTSICIFPKELQLPFNPLDPVDETFDSKNKFIVKNAPSEFVKAVKEAMREDEELHKYYAKLLGKTVEEYDISSDEITDADFTIFNEYTVPAHYSADTQKITTVECGKFGTERLSPLEKDENGTVINADEYLIGRLFELERDIRDEKIAEFYLDNDKNNLTSDQKDKIATIRRSVKVSYPKKSGVILFIELFGKTSKDGEITLDPIKDFTLESSLRYYNCNPEELKKINKKLHKKKTDKFLDYIVLKIEYGDGIDSSDTTPELALYKSREYQNISYETEEDPATAIEGFKYDAVVTLFNSGLEGKFEQLVKKSIWKFRPVSDKDLCEMYLSRVKEIVPYVTEQIYTKYGDVFEMVSLQTKKELDTLKENNKLRISSKNIIKDEDSVTELSKQIEDLNKIDTLDVAEDVIDAEIEGLDISDLVNVN